MGHLRRRLSALVVAAACLGLAACGGQDKPRPVPAGFVRYQGAGYFFDYPSGWTVAQAKDDMGRPVVQVQGPPTADGVAQGVVRIGRAVKVEMPFDLQLGQYRAGSLLDGRRINVDRKIKLAGAAEAHRFEADYPTQVAVGRSVRVKAVDIFVLTSNRTLLDFVSVAPEIGGADMSQVLASFRLGKAEK